MQDNDRVEDVLGFGALPIIAAARFSPNADADPTIIHSFGVETIVRSTEGDYTATLSNNNLEALGTGLPMAIVAVVFTGVGGADDGANYFQVRSITESTGVITLTHTFTADPIGTDPAPGDGEAAPAITSFMLLVYGMRG